MMFCVGGIVAGHVSKDVICHQNINTPNYTHFSAGTFSLLSMPFRALMCLANNNQEGGTHGNSAHQPTGPSWALAGERNDFGALAITGCWTCFPEAARANSVSRAGSWSVWEAVSPHEHVGSNGLRSTSGFRALTLNQTHPLRPRALSIPGRGFLSGDDLIGASVLHLSTTVKI